jgi:AAA domain-containing protein
VSCQRCGNPHAARSEQLGKTVCARCLGELIPPAEYERIADVTARPGDADGDSPGSGRQLIPRVLSNVAPTRARWAWEGRMPLGAVTLLAGRQGLGKSTLLADITARLTRGTLPGDLHGQPTAVLIASYEDTYESTTVPRLLAAGADLDLAVGLDLFEDGRPGLLSLPGDLDLISSTARQYKAGALLIDPLMAGLSGGVDSHRDQDVRRALAPLRQLAADADLAILAVLHLRKGTASEALDRISGSVAFTAAARSVLAFGRGDEEEDCPDRVLAHAKSNLGPLAPSLAYRVEPETVCYGGLDIPTSRLVSKGECEVGAGELLSPPPAEDRSEVEIAAEWLADELADGEWHGSREVKASARAADIRERTLQRAMRQLGVEDRREGFPAVSEWRLPVTPRGVGEAANGAPGATRGCGSVEPKTAGESPQSRQGAHTGATGPDKGVRGRSATDPYDPWSEWA